MTQRHVLAVNFRDPTHPEAGGAELHLEEILLEAVRRGMRVSWLASGYPGAAREAEHRGMRIVRRGDWWNFNLIVPGVLKREFSSPSPDLIVEDINKAPCLTPLWTNAEVAAIVPHLFGATATREAPLPIALYVMLLEALIPFVYRRSRFLAISESTRDDLIRRGVRGSRIAVVHCGMDHETYRVDPAVQKSERPTVLFVGRLRRYKGLGWVMRSLPRVLAKRGDARLEVVGDGPHQTALKLEAARVGVAASVDFLGFLPRAEKVRRMQRAWMLIQPSPKEGWGLTVVEAGACGTAVVAAASPGLRDSVRDGVTGLLVPYDDSDRLADAILSVLEDAKLRDSLGREGVKWAARFTWPDCARRSLDALFERAEQPERAGADAAREGSA
jgi:glycosyltransferase involved in cell wall biosynthesis